MTHDSNRPMPRRPLRWAAPLAAMLLGATVLTGCQVSDLGTAKHMAPVSSGLERKMARMGMDKRSPIMLRIYKEDDLLEVWKRDKSGKYKKLTEFEICAWSGKLGPKKKEGDRQAPEGFYTVSRGQMNPNSSYHLSFDLGFPNTFDRSHGRTGSHLMVHGDCSSRGCYAMEDEAVEEIYALAREAFIGGQQAFQVQAFPFRMTPENMARHADNENLAFWENLKEGADHFEVTGQAPKVSVCGRKYVFNAESTSGFSPTAACPDYRVEPSVEQLVVAKRTSDLEKRATVIAKAKMRDQREERWEEREKAIAGFFSRARADSDEPQAEGSPGEATSGAAGTTTTASTGGAVPVPRVPPAAGRSNRAPVASVAGTSQPTAPAADTSQTPVASTAGTETQPQALGYAAEDDDAGFFSSVAKSSRGLFQKAGKLFN